MQFTIGNEALSSYKRLNYKEWYAFAEFVDNSTQAYFNNKIKLDELLKSSNETLTIEFEYEKNDKNEIQLLRIKDNSSGMSFSELENALKVGKRPDKNGRRSVYGLGLKTSACWLGDFWSIRSKKFGETDEIKYEIDVAKISNLEITTIEPRINNVSDINSHYTVIEISKLHRSFHPKTTSKILQFLGSMYRLDFEKYNIKIIVNGTVATYTSLDNRIHIDRTTKTKMERKFEFSINEKIVKGRVCVLSDGSRKDAGFNVFINDRAIYCWPQAYKPESLFGENGGTNNLANQRVFGDLFLTGFEVSHTKTDLIFDNDDGQLFEENLFQNCNDFIEYANNMRVQELEELDDDAIGEITKDLISELSSKYYNEFYNFEIPDVETIRKMDENVIEKVLNSNRETFKVSIGNLSITVYLDITLSPYDKYVFYVPPQLDTLHIIINRSHPYFSEIKSIETLTEYIRECVFDGASEWKATKNDVYESNTIRLLKDNLLRCSFNFHENK